MRFAVLFLAVLVGVGAFFLLTKGESSPSQEAETLAPLAPEGLGPELAPAEASAELTEAPAEGPKEIDAAAIETIEREEAGFSGENLVEFHGSALLQPKGQRPYPAVRGTIEIAILNHGRLVPVSVDVTQGKFRVEVPDRCRIRVEGGVLEDQAVRFLGTDGPFTLDAALDYALVGEPIPIQRLRVFEGTQHVPLAKVTVRTGVDGATAQMTGGAPVGEVLVAEAASPIDLPFMPGQRPVWLHVSAEGYATTALLINPLEAAEKDVVLWPSATLNVRVTGPARDRLKALILHRNEPAAAGQKPSKRHFATIGMNATGITRDPDAIIFNLENVPALPLTLEARGFDKRGRETLLGTTSVVLGTNQAGRVELRLDEK